MNRCLVFTAAACLSAAHAAEPAVDSGAALDTARYPEPKVQHIVIADGATRIDELRVRGQTQRLAVQPKGMKGYEIIPAGPGRDLSDSASSQRGASGKRVWQILDF